MSNDPTIHGSPEMDAVIRHNRGAAIGWMCPKCGRVYSPVRLDCRTCNLRIERGERP